MNKLFAAPLAIAGIIAFAAGATADGGRPEGAGKPSNVPVVDPQDVTPVDGSAAGDAATSDIPNYDAGEDVLEALFGGE